ncbi:MAG: hypothetical protein IPL47_01230 [Phyllobacteriaceae bacterium]|nr:hypothetical protein [Phyllobacteriaceae bacterium]
MSGNENSRSGDEYPSMRIFFDITGTVEYLRKHGNYSGIQRTAVNILSAIIKNSCPDKKRYIIFYNKNLNRYLCIDLNNVTSEDVINYDKFGMIVGIKARRKKNKLPTEVLGKHGGLLFS